MIALFTDFGWNGPYVGQMKAVLYKNAPASQIIDLLHDAPTFNPRASAYLLAALVGSFPKDTVFLCVVDPGVGSPRKPVIIKANDHWFVGPENGLFNVIATRADKLEYWDITWQPETLSKTFHGRDLFAPVAALLDNGKMYNVEKVAEPPTRLITGWDDDLSEIIYIDSYGNCMTGLRANTIEMTARIEIANMLLEYKPCFSEVTTGEPFWYINSIGLVELAMNQASIAKNLKLAEGNKVWISG